MKTVTISMITMLVLVAVVAAQTPGTLRSAGSDLLAAMSGDMVRFERGMKTLEDLLSKTEDADMAALDAAYRQLGIAPNGGRLQFSTRADAVRLRRALMGRRASTKLGSDRKGGL